MEHVNSKDRISRQPLSTLGKVTVGALLVNACAQFVGVVAHLLLGEGLIVPLLIVGVILLLVAGLAATGMRWTALLGALVVLAVNVLLITQPTNSFALLHPGADVGHFVGIVISLASALVAIVAGIGATMQNDRGSAPPRS